MRILDKKFEDMFANEYKGIIDYVKEHENVFLGIRKNYINLYVDGGSFLKLKYYPRLKKCIGSIDKEYFANCEMPKGLSKINGEEVKDINDWIRLFDSLIVVIQKYQRGELSKKEESENIKREKIIQQKLLKEFNEKSNYFAYDIEYSMEGVSDYVLDSNGNPIKTEKDNYRVKSLGRADIMLISKPINNKIKIYSMEVKEGTGAFGGVLANKSENKSAPSFGSGIAGHLKNNVAIINCARKGIEYVSKGGKKKFDIRKTLLEEIKYCIHFYNRFGILKNENFNKLTDDEINKLELVNEENSVELVFFLGDYKYKTPSSFENHLGILGNPKDYSDYAVKKLLNNKKSNEIDLDYIEYDKLFDFKVLKTSKNCFDSNFDLDIENYDIIKKSLFKD